MQSIVAGAVTVLLTAFAPGYGYHRDELYFLAAGRHLAWAYPDQGVVTPLIARAMSEVAPDSLTALRLPSAVAAGLTVLLTGALARELGGGRRAELVAAACAASATIVLFTGHLLSTSTFDLLAWTAVTWLVVRAMRRDAPWLWPAAGAVLGIGLMNKPLPAFLAAGLLAGVVIAGPRRLLRTPHVWLGAGIALLIWSPWIVWQAGHGWPQIDVSRSLSGGNSTSSEPWWAVVPFQALLASPPLAPVWIAGLVGLARHPSLRDVRFIAVAWAVLAVVFMASGGKPYYLAGLLPALIAAGAVSTDRWLARRRRRARTSVLVAAVVSSFLVSCVISLPVLPAADIGPVVTVNEDVGETIGWPELVRTVARVHRAVPGAVILTRNYGEAGAIDRYGAALGLPRAYSGHNAYGQWGPPTAGTAPVVTVGFRPEDARPHFRDCRVAARIENNAGVENEERRAYVLICQAPRHAWSREWPRLRHLG
jgi:4-amino-4-deoxy-L-arabinose transferase-like glycosyltransferase